MNHGLLLRTFFRATDTLSRKKNCPDSITMLDRLALQCSISIILSLPVLHMENNAWGGILEPYKESRLPI